MAGRDQCTVLSSRPVQHTTFAGAAFWQNTRQQHFTVADCSLTDQSFNRISTEPSTSP
jgi:hypothetical protein